MTKVVNIKSYTRRSKKGNTIKVKSYTRRIGRKGVRSPKRVDDHLGKELEEVVTAKAEQNQEAQEKPRARLTPEEIAERRENTEGFKRAEAARQLLGMSREQYSRYVLQKEREGARRANVTPKRPTSTPTKKPMGFFERVEDKIANFVEKYSGKKYKRQL